MLQQFAAIVVIVATALAMVTCLRIEILNARAGYFLPRDLSAEAGKWRAAAGDRGGDALRHAVSTWGLLQYPLVFALVAMLPFMIRSQRGGWRVALATSLVLAIGCAAMMFYRGYFSSLSW